MTPFCYQAKSLSGFGTSMCWCSLGIDSKRVSDQKTAYITYQENNYSADSCKDNIFSIVQKIN